MTIYAADSSGLIFRAKVLEAGLTDDDLRRSLRQGEIVRVTRGVFAVAAKRNPEEVHRLRALAAAKDNPQRPLTHQSAAVILGLPMLRPNLRRVHTTARTGKGFRTTTHHCHVAQYDDEDIVTVDGVRVTGIERTAVEVACTAKDFAAALTIFDSALRAKADREVMARMLTDRRRGTAQARRALHHADGAAENPGESWSRAQLIEAGLPPARLQYKFFDADGNEVARTDFDWDGKLVGEFDGKVKYKKLLRPGEDPAEVVIREKAREDALRRMGIMVIRWVWRDLEQRKLVAMVREWLVNLTPAA
uniref:hypothetical protein n=1 Tax=Gordonia sp. B7-2 TaxID=3420932 RepID=UPI003D8F4204